METVGWGREIGLVALAAIVIFWVVGAYNRLTALRFAIGEAFARIDEVLARRQQALDGLLPALATPLQSEQSSLMALATALGEGRAAAAALRQRPADAARAMALATAEQALAAALARVTALVDNQPDLGQSPTVAPAMARLGDCAAQLAFARRAFNEGVAAYNLAVQQWPTRIVARLFGLADAAPL